MKHCSACHEYYPDQLELACCYSLHRIGRGVALFIGGPLDEQVRELVELVPVYLVPYMDQPPRVEWTRKNALTPLTYTMLRYRRKAIRPGLAADGRERAIYEFEL